MSASGHRACLLLGSNLQPEKNLELGLDLLRQKVTVLQSSSVWETPAVGEVGPDFLNMAVLAATPLEADELKEKILRPLEAQLGRVRSGDKNAARPIDIDIILFDGRQLDPILWQFAFRAVPVAELMPDLRSSQGELLKDVAYRLAHTSPIRLKTIQLSDNRLHT